MRQQRIVIVFVLLMLGYAAVLTRLVRLQVVETDMWTRESRLSTQHVQTLPFERGWITDRHGVPLATTESVRDLVFAYRDWRRETILGQLAHAAWTLGEPLPSARAVLDEAERRIDALGAVSVRRIAEIDVRQRRRDLGFYLGGLFGDVLWRQVEDRLRDELLPRDVRLDELSTWPEGRAEALARLAHERASLDDLAAATGLTRAVLLDAVDTGVRRAHQRVDGALAADQAAALAAAREGDAPLALRAGLDAALSATRALSGAPPPAAAAPRASVAAPWTGVMLDGLLGDPRETYKKLQQLHVEFDAEPVLVASRVPYDVQTLVAIRRRELAGFEVSVQQRRVYPPEVAQVAPLVVGRVGAPREDDVEEAADHRLRLANLASLTDLRPEELDAYETLRVLVREVDYAYGEERGLLGVESALEDVLRGKRGWIATSFGVEAEETERVEPVRGLNVTLTLDVDLQQACQEVLDAAWEHPPLPEDRPADVPLHWSGAIVLMDARTGAVLALASGPRPTREQLDDELGWLYTGDPEATIRHRAVRPGRTGNLAPPGSTFKPVSALTALVAGTIAPTTTFDCEGRLRVGRLENDVKGCLGVHGEIDLQRAVAKSCNVYFYHVGAQVGGEALRAMADKLGFGRRRPLLSGNAALARMGVAVGDGFLEIAPRLGDRPDTSVDAMSLAIGQAPLDDVTPLQVATMMAALGTGSLPWPSLVRSVERLGDVPLSPPEALGVPQGHLATVRRTMEAVVDTGTGKPLHALQPELAPFVAGKTGTAQVHAGRDHAWFAGYAPRAAPKLAFAVLVEDVHLHGGDAALPLFAQLLDKPAVRAFLAREVLPKGALPETDP